jgi:hypothetical protein
MAAIISQMALAIWLLASAFMWPHSDGQLMLALVGGLLGVLLSSVALMRGKQGVHIGLLGGWLLFGALSFSEQSRLSCANHVIVGVGMLLLSQIESTSRRLRQGK